MGCCASAEDYTPPGTGATEDGPRLVLTSKGAADAIYFENAHALRQPGEPSERSSPAPATQASRPGAAAQGSSASQALR